MIKSNSYAILLIELVLLYLLINSIAIASETNTNPVESSPSSTPSESSSNAASSAQRPITDADLELVEEIVKEEAEKDKEERRKEVIREKKKFFADPRWKGIVEVDDNGNVHKLNEQRYNEEVQKMEAERKARIEQEAKNGLEQTRTKENSLGNILRHIGEIARGESGTTSEKTLFFIFIACIAVALLRFRDSFSRKKKY